MVRKRPGWILFFAYVLFLLWLTIFSRAPRQTERVFKWQLLWAYRAWIAGESYGKSESLQNIYNILVFMPFGILFPLKRWKPLIITALVLSSFIEAVQYSFNIGWCETDDVICNVLGAAIGFGVCKWVKGKVNAFREKDRLL